MELFAKRVFGFLAVFAVIIALFALFLNKVHKFAPSAMYYSEEFNRAFREKNSELIAIGNSKLLSSLDKITLEQGLRLKTSLLGFSSGNISVSKLVLESYLNQCVAKPKVVLLEVSWFTFNNNRTHFHDITGQLFLRDPKIWTNFFTYYPEILPNISSAILKTLWSLAVGNRNNASFADNFRGKKTGGHQFNREVMKTLFPDQKAGINPALLRDFKAIVRMCDNYGIPLILFTAPEDTLYAKSQKDIKLVKSEFFQIVENNKNDLYLDFTSGGALWNEKYESWLGDSHHINENGLFTIELVLAIQARTHKYGYAP